MLLRLVQSRIPSLWKSGAAREACIWRRSAAQSEVHVRSAGQKSQMQRHDDWRFLQRHYAQALAEAAWCSRYYWGERQYLKHQEQILIVVLVDFRKIFWFMAGSLATPEASWTTNRFCWSKHKRIREPRWFWICPSWRSTRCFPDKWWQWKGRTWRAAIRRTSLLWMPFIRKPVLTFCLTHL